MPINRYLPFLFLIIIGLCVVQTLRSFSSVEEEFRYLVYGKTIDANFKWIDIDDPADGEDAYRGLRNDTVGGVPVQIMEILRQKVEKGYRGKVQVILSYVSGNYTEKTFFVPPETALNVFTGRHPIPLEVLPGEPMSARLTFQTQKSSLIPSLIACLMCVVWVLWYRSTRAAKRLETAKAVEPVTAKVSSRKSVASKNNKQRP